MHAIHPRPTSIWIALCVLALYIALLVVVMVVGPPDPSVLDEPEFGDWLINVVEAIITIASLVVGFVALAARRQWGRWFVTATLVYFVGTLAYGLIVFPDPDPVADQDALIGWTLGLSPLLFVLILTSFGESVREYFALRPRDDDQETKEN
jgi:hypothetical protein